MKTRYIIMWTSVRSLCIREQYYTRGNNKEYASMLDLCDNGSTLKDIEQIAMDIYVHSNKEKLDSRYAECGKDTVKVIMEYIINECVWMEVVN